mgnify:CR=1 FL=1
MSFPGVSAHSEFEFVDAQSREIFQTFVETVIAEDTAYDTDLDNFFPLFQIFSLMTIFSAAERAAASISL